MQIVSQPNFLKLDIKNLIRPDWIPYILVWNVTGNTTLNLSLTVATLPQVQLIVIRYEFLGNYHWVVNINPKAPRINVNVKSNGFAL